MAVFCCGFGCSASRLARKRRAMEWRIALRGQKLKTIDAAAIRSKGCVLGHGLLFSVRFEVWLEANEQQPTQRPPAQVKKSWDLWKDCLRRCALISLRGKTGASGTRSSANGSASQQQHPRCAVHFRAAPKASPAAKVSRPEAGVVSRGKACCLVVLLPW